MELYACLTLTCSRSKVLLSLVGPGHKLGELGEVGGDPLQGRVVEVPGNRHEGFGVRSLGSRGDRVYDVVHSCHIGRLIRNHRNGSISTL